MSRRDGVNIPRKKPGFYEGRQSSFRYKAYVTPALARTLDEMIGDGVPEEQLQLYDELALMRVAAGKAVATYAAASEAAEKQPDNAKLQALQDHAAMLMRDALREVISTCEAAARVAASAKDKVPAQMLQVFVHQVTQCAYQAFGDDDDGRQKVEEFARLIRTEVRLNSGDYDATGTSKTPDMDVDEMDDTVPKRKYVHDRDLLPHVEAMAAQANSQHLVEEDGDDDEKT